MEQMRDMAKVLASTSYESSSNIDSSRLRCLGHWAVDYEGNKSVVRYDIHEPHHEEVKNLYLERHDLVSKYCNNTSLFV